MRLSSSLIFKSREAEKQRVAKLPKPFRFYKKKGKDQKETVGFLYKMKKSPKF